MRKLFLSVFSVYAVSSAYFVVAEPDEDARMNQLSQQQQQEYQRQLNQAAGDQERNEIKERYREMSHEQQMDAARPGVDCGNRGSGKGGQPGNPCVEGKAGAMKKGDGRGVPAGDKNRPQKSGR